MSQLSTHFSLAELTQSETAALHGIPNTPDEAALDNLTRLAVTVLEPAREVCGVPFRVHDGYRCPAVNRLVGGVAHSAHQDGLAADVEAIGLSLRAAFDTIRASDVPFDQCILESGCVHLACARVGETPRRQALIRGGTPDAWTYRVAPAVVPPSPSGA